MVRVGGDLFYGYYEGSIDMYIRPDLCQLVSWHFLVDWSTLLEDRYSIRDDSTGADIQNICQRKTISQNELWSYCLPPSCNTQGTL